MVILASIAILYGGGIPKEASLASVYNEMKEIKSTINEAQILGKIKKGESEITFFNEATAPKINNSDYSEVVGNNASGDYYLLDFTSTKTLKNALDLENVKNNYILKLDTLNIYIINGVEIMSGDESTIQYDSEEVGKYFKNAYKK